MKLDLHVHTGHSFDSSSEPAEIIRAAEAAGLDAIAITDHDTMSAVGLVKKSSSKITIIPGMEITSIQGTHIIGLFLQNEIISRDIFEMIDEVHAQDGLVLMPHPFREGSGFLSHRFHEKIYDGDQFDKILGQIDLVEAFTYGADPEDMVDTGKFLAVHPEMALCSGSNAHTIADIGKAYFEIEEFDTNNLNEIKYALLDAPRLLRYEAYSAENDETVVKTARCEGRSGLLNKIVDATLGPVMSSIKNLYRKPKNTDGDQS